MPSTATIAILGIAGAGLAWKVLQKPKRRRSRICNSWKPHPGLPIVDAIAIGRAKNGILSWTPKEWERLGKAVDAAAAATGKPQIAGIAPGPIAAAIAAWSFQVAKTALMAVCPKMPVPTGLGDIDAMKQKEGVWWADIWDATFGLAGKKASIPTG